ncbi:protease [Gossypium australe]|uniref:Protease n=1 Tax=Gossypium australe TaxID=47621 RepID=A0A5B6VCL4_9ROSI|nr:protease [Gossypium australe]
MQALAPGTVQPQRVVQQPPKGCGQARGGNGLGRGQRAPNRGAGQTQVRQLTSVYVVHCREDRDTPDVMTGTFFIFVVPYFALIDIRSTHSYITYFVSENLRLSVESTSSEVTVICPLGQSVQVSKLHKDVPLEVQGEIFLANLMDLPFREFDLILEHRVSLDCASKRVIMRTKDDVEMVMIGERRDYISHVISALVAEKLVRKECEVCLVYVNTTASRNSSIRDIRTVMDFPDFPS